ncbi:GtrA family protein [Planobispora siamensis]
MTEVDVRPTSRNGSPARMHGLPPVLRGQRITYLAGGVMTVASYFSLLTLGLLIFEGGVPYLFLVVVSHLCTVVIVYPWYRVVVFRVTEGSWIAGYLRFYVVCLGFLATSLAGLPILVELAGLPVLVAQFLIMGAGALLGYAVNRSWTFRERAKV